jgi:hypothetical protein
MGDELEWREIHHGLRITTSTHQTGGGNVFLYMAGFGSVIGRVQWYKYQDCFDHSGNIYRSACFNCSLGSHKAAIQEVKRDS